MNKKLSAPGEVLQDDSRSFEIKNNITELSYIKNEFDSLYNLWQCDEEAKLDIDLAVEEILTNIIHYAYKDSDEHKIQVKLEKLDDLIKGEIIDDGIYFDPLKALPPNIAQSNLDAVRVGGMGILLSRIVLTSLEYKRVENRNVITFTKIINTSKGTQMIINESQHEDLKILSIEGRLDITSVEQLEAKFNELIDKGVTKILLDCTQLTFISSAGLRILIVAQKKLEPHKGEVVIFGFNDYTKKIFEITGYFNLFSIFETKEEALKHFNR